MAMFPFQTPIIGANRLTVGDFWMWAYSDLLNNANRGVLAEFLVAAALGVADQPRIEWNEIDLLYRDKGIEVKSAAYCQSWSQTTLSKIIFGIPETMGWNAATNTYRSERGRAADCFIFCLYKEMDTTLAREHLLNLDYWEFFVISTPQVIAAFGGQKSVGLASLQRLSEPVDYHNLKAAIDQALTLSPEV